MSANHIAIRSRPRAKINTSASSSQKAQKSKMGATKSCQGGPSQ